MKTGWVYSVTKSDYDHKVWAARTCLYVIVNSDNREAVAELIPGLLIVMTTSSLKYPMCDYIFASKLNNSKRHWNFYHIYKLLWWPLECFRIMALGLHPHTSFRCCTTPWSYSEGSYSSMVPSFCYVNSFQKYVFAVHNMLKWHTNKNKVFFVFFSLFFVNMIYDKVIWIKHDLVYQFILSYQWLMALLSSRYKVLHTVNFSTENGKWLSEPRALQ